MSFSKRSIITVACAVFTGLGGCRTASEPSSAPSSGVGVVRQQAFLAPLPNMARVSTRPASVTKRATISAAQQEKITALVARMAARMLDSEVNDGAAKDAATQTLQAREARLAFLKTHYSKLFAFDTDGKLYAQALQAESDPKAYYQPFLIALGNANPEWIRDQYDYALFDDILSRSLRHLNLPDDFLEAPRTKRAIAEAILKPDCLEQFQTICIDLQMVTALGLPGDIRLKREAAYDRFFNALVKPIAAPFFEKKNNLENFLPEDGPASNRA